MNGREVALSARDGLRIAGTEWPSARDRAPLLCLPGICRTRLDFAALGARHAGTRRVVALDYIGHGDSERAADPARYRPEALIRDVLDAMAALHLHRVVLVGTSFGGICAMAMGAMRPAALAAVALNDIGPSIAPAARGAVLDLVGRDPALASLDEAVAWLRAHHPPLPGLDEEGWRAFAARTFAPGADGRWHPRWDIRVGQQAVGAAAGRPPDLWGLFGALRRLPLMLVWGEASTLLTAGTVAAMRAARPDMAVAALPGTGHAPTLHEAPAVAALDAFIAAQP